MLEQKKILIHGHRGARGLYPENTLNAFLEAVKLGVDALEMDVIISKDKQLVVSHEAWMNELFCSRPDGTAIETNSANKYNLYQMDYREIKTFDCGKRGHPDFPFQKKQPAYKPLFSEVIQSIDRYCHVKAIPPMLYTIELKTEEGKDGIFQPAPAEFVQLVGIQLTVLNLFERCIIQSFDTRILQELHKQHPQLKLSFLVENNNGLSTNLNKLGFLPNYYCPEYPLFNAELIAELQKLNITPMTWTVNHLNDYKQLVQLGLRNIITDYPDRIRGW